jgi:hypothetical protein
MPSQIRQCEQGAATVTGVMEPDDQLCLDQAIHQFRRAVVSDAKKRSARSPTVGRWVSGKPLIANNA